MRLHKFAQKFGKADEIQNVTSVEPKDDFLQFWSNIWISVRFCGRQAEEHTAGERFISGTSIEQIFFSSFSVLQEV